MAPARYLNFELLVEPQPPGLRAYVIDSPVGQALHSAAQLPAAGSAPGDPAQIGARLFSAVFDGEVESCLRRSQDAARRESAGLRIRLRVADPGLAQLPWEYLYDAARDQFLALSVLTPVVRYVDLPEPAVPLAVAPPLRMLVAVAAPFDYAPLAVEREWTQLSTALAGLVQRELLVVERLDAAELPALQDRLREQTYHLLHFIGHGELSADGAGALVFGGAAQPGQPVGGRVLGALLHDQPALRLVVLNACDGARATTGSAFAGVAQSCVEQGVPAVVAMQAAISDAAAVTLSQTFYDSLADGFAVDAALAEGRKAIFAGGADGEWAIPVLFMRAGDGRLWPVRAEETTMEPHAQPDAAPDPPWWERIPSDVGGDVIIANVGAGASGVAVGKGITQQITSVLGPPQPNDRDVIAAQFARVVAALQSNAAQVDPGTAQMAKFQLQLLEGELTKVGADEVPSASTLTQVGDWLLDNVPAIAEALIGLFATPAVGKVVGKAGQGAVAWVRRRFAAPAR